MFLQLSRMFALYYVELEGLVVYFDLRPFEPADSLVLNRPEKKPGHQSWGNKIQDSE